jgi:hypothetical protein
MGLSLTQMYFFLAFNMENADTRQDTVFATPPSRPPSRVNTNESLNPVKYGDGINLSATTNASGELVFCNTESKSLT